MGTAGKLPDDGRREGDAAGKEAEDGRGETGGAAGKGPEDGRGETGGAAGKAPDEGRGERGGAAGKGPLDDGSPGRPLEEGATIGGGATISPVSRPRTDGVGGVKDAGPEGGATGSEGCEERGAGNADCEDGGAATAGREGTDGGGAMFLDAGTRAEDDLGDEPGGVRSEGGAGYRAAGPDAPEG